MSIRISFDDGADFGLWRQRTPNESGIVLKRGAGNQDPGMMTYLLCMHAHNPFIRGSDNPLSAPER